MAMAMFKRKFARTIPDNLEGTAQKNVGFRGKKGQKVHPNFAPNITILFSLPCFFLSLIFTCADQEKSENMPRVWTCRRNIAEDPNPLMEAELLYWAGFLPNWESTIPPSTPSIGSKFGRALLNNF